MHERLLKNFELVSDSDNTIVLKNKQDFTYTLSLFTPVAFRVTLSGPDRPLPPHDNYAFPLPSPIAFEGYESDPQSQTVRFTLGDGKRVCLNYTTDLILSVTETLQDLPEDDERRERLVYSTLPTRGYLLSEHGITRYNRFVPETIHFGLGEKAAPLDLTGRGFEMSGTDAAAYDAYLTDPLYKHTPFLITIPLPFPTSPPTHNLLNNYHASINLIPAGTSDPMVLKTREYIRPSGYTTYYPSNSDGCWDLRRSSNDPQGVFTKYTQDWGGLEELVFFGDHVGREEGFRVERKALERQRDGEKGGRRGVEELVTAFARVVGFPKLVPRDWLGYLASGMGMGESDSPPAQELLSTWPDLCAKYDIPCSAIHLSSGYTVGDDGNRYVFGSCEKRYPDFAEMVRGLHRRGIKVVPNIKPYVLQSHPDYPRLQKAGALFYDPFTESQVITPIWSSGVGVTSGGSWVDMTHPEGRKWWYDGVTKLVEQGCDGMWNDNNEYLLHNDEYVPAWDEDSKKTNAFKGKINVGTLGRMYNTQLMAKMSHDACVDANPDRRPFVLTRSGNVGTFRYASSTWSGDNYSNWKTLQGSVAMGLNAGLSLIQSYGTDVGGFAGPLPSPELFLRWVQYGCTNSRFCIHSFKPNKADPNGSATNNLPWMYPEVLPAIRKAIKRRYELLPYFNSLNWESHLLAESSNSFLGSGPFSQDPNLFSSEILNGFDYWLGTGRLLVTGAFFEAQRSKKVYFPRGFEGDDTPFFRVGGQGESYSAGTWGEVDLPLEESTMFARAGSVLPIGRAQVTVTVQQGLAGTCVGGTEIEVTTQSSEETGIALDDFRGIEIFPPSSEYASSHDFHGSGTWIEDDGVSLEPKTTMIKVDYRVQGEEIIVDARYLKNDFETLWKDELHVVLPVGDSRVVSSAKSVERNGKKYFVIPVVQ